METLRCSYDPSACDLSFDGLLESLREAPHGDDLQLKFEVEDYEGTAPSVSVTKTKRMDKVVTGYLDFSVQVQ